MKPAPSILLAMAIGLVAVGAGVPASAEADNIAAFQVGDDFEKSVAFDMTFDPETRRAFAVRGATGEVPGVLAAIDVASETMYHVPSDAWGFPRIAFDPSRDLYIASSHTIEVRSRDSLELLRVFSNTLQSPSAIVVHPATHLIYTSHWYDSALLVTDPTTGLSTTVPMPWRPGLMTIAPSRDELYVMVQDAIHIIDTNTLTIKGQIDDLRYTNHILVDEETDRLFLSDPRFIPGRGGAYGIRIADLSTREEIAWVETPHGMGPIALDRERSILYASLYTIDLETLEVEETLLAALDGETFEINPDDVAVDPKTHLLLASNPWHSRVDLIANDDEPPMTAFDSRPDTVAVRSLGGSTIAGTTTDDSAGVARVLVRITRNRQESTTEEVPVTCGGNRLSCSWHVEATGMPGLYEVAAWAIDRVGNASTPTRATFVAV